MTVSVPEAYIEAYLEDTSRWDQEVDPDVVIPGEDIISVEIGARVGEIMDSFTLELHNHDGEYSQRFPLDSGDRLVFHAPHDEAEVYGEEWYGTGIYGGYSLQTWTGIVQDVDVTRTSPDISVVRVSGTDFAGDVISNRQVSDNYINDDIGEIMRDIIEAKAPEVNPTRIPNFGVETDISFSSHDCWDALQNLAARGDVILIPQGQSLRAEPISELPYVFDLETRDFFEPPTLSTKGDIKNVIRVDAGENRKLEQEQPFQDRFFTVNENRRLTQRIRARKAEIHSIDIYTRRGSEEDRLTARIQSDENGEPVAINDEDSDIASAGWEGDNIAADGWSFFSLPTHTLADRDPWLILESDGEEGHEIATNEDGDISYRSFYPFPINFEVQSTDSVEKYGSRELQVEREGLQTLTAVRDAGYAELARRAWPTKSIEFEASSFRAHQLRPGMRIGVDRPWDGIEGEYIVTEVDSVWDSSTVQLKTVITAEWRQGILADIDRI